MRPVDVRADAARARARARELVERSVRAVADASGVVAVAQRSSRPRDDAAERLAQELAGLRRAMESRAVIEQAKGIVMGATGCDAKAAFQVLVRQSQHENRKLRDVAEELVSSKQVEQRS
jgi:AmiR/NasT family two-component response regulator